MFFKKVFPFGMKNGKIKKLRRRPGHIFMYHFDQGVIFFRGRKILPHPTYNHPKTKVPLFKLRKKNQVRKAQHPHQVMKMVAGNFPLRHRPNRLLRKQWIDGKPVVSPVGISNTIFHQVKCRKSFTLMSFYIRESSCFIEQHLYFTLFSTKMFTFLFKLWTETFTNTRFPLMRLLNINNYSTRARWIRAELVIIILYPASPSRVIILLKTPWCATRNYSKSYHFVFHVIRLSVFSQSHHAVGQTVI